MFDNYLQKLICDKGIEIIKDVIIFGNCIDKRILRIIDVDDCIYDFFKSTLSICIINDDTGCVVKKDVEDYGDCPYVLIHGHIQNCDGVHKYHSMSLFPDKGQTLDELYCFLLSCVNAKTCTSKQQQFDQFSGDELIITTGVLPNDPSMINIFVDGTRLYPVNVETGEPQWSQNDNVITINKQASDCDIMVEYLECN